LVAAAGECCVPPVLHGEPAGPRIDTGIPGVYVPILTRPPRSTLFPYTPLFRSGVRGRDGPGGDERARRGRRRPAGGRAARRRGADRKSTRLNSSHVKISSAVFCLQKKSEGGAESAPGHVRPANVDLGDDTQQAT